MSRDPALAAQLVRQAQELLSKVDPDPAGKPTEQAIRLFEQALEKLGSNDKQARATVTYNLGICFRQRRAGDRGENLKRAIAYLENSSALCDPERQRPEWSRAQNALGVTLRERRQGDLFENQTRAASALERALEARPAASAPLDRAATLCNLANLNAQRHDEERPRHIEAALTQYEEALGLLDPDDHHTRTAILFNRATVLLDRVAGERSKNIEAAITDLKEALELGRTGEDAIAAKLALANAFALRIKGEKAENLEQAVELVEEVLRHRDRARDPFLWANAQNSRGLIFARRVHGGRADNIEQAIHSHRLALEVYDADIYPAERAGALNNLASVLRARPLGDRSANEEEAIAALEEALSVYTRADDPFSWAGTMSNLGTAYFERRAKDPNQNIERAIDAYRQALEVRTENTSPWDWAATQFNLGQALWRRYRGDRVRTLQEAEAALRASLRVRNENLSPEAWAGTMSMLAVVLDEQVERGFSSLLDEAIAAYRNALRVFQPEDFPFEARANANNLAGLYLREARMEEALATALEGIRAAEILYGSAPTEDGRELEVGDNARLYRIAAEAALDSGHPAAEAFELSESGRGRLLGDWLAAGDLDAPASVPSELLETEGELLAQLREELAAIRRGSDSAVRIEVAARAATVRAELEQVWSQISTAPEGDRYAAQRRGERLKAAQLQDWLDQQPGTPGMVTFSSLRDEPIAFLARKGSRAMEAVRYPVDTAEIDDLLERLHKEVIQARKPSRKPETWSRIGEALMTPALERLGDLSLLYVVPLGGLHSVPWHASSVDGEPLLNRVPLAYAPTVAAAVRLSRPVPRHFPPRSALVVGDPCRNLTHGATEAMEVAARLEATECLLGADATVAEVRRQMQDKEWVHLAAHAHYSPDDPLASGISLADGTLNARQLVDGTAPKTVVVSACESGRQLPAPGDELWGLGRALLYAGTDTAVLSLWRVADQVSKELMSHFYERLEAEEDKSARAARALREAMLRVRVNHPQTFLWAPFSLIGNPF